VYKDLNQSKQKNKNKQSKLKVMKKHTTILFSQLGEVQVRTLTTIVKETLALDYQPQQPAKKFTAADLWKIQGQKRSFPQRRFIF
jgi:hypothetical protein